MLHQAEVRAYPFAIVFPRKAIGRKDKKGQLSKYSLEAIVTDLRKARLNLHLYWDLKKENIYMLINATYVCCSGSAAACVVVVGAKLERLPCSWLPCRRERLEEQADAIKYVGACRCCRRVVAHPSHTHTPPVAGIGCCWTRTCFAGATRQ